MTEAEHHLENARNCLNQPNNLYRTSGVPWLTPHVQFQRAIDAVDPLVVPEMTLHVAQVQEK
ncbi:hypothetical protein, partial [Paracoccus hibiscisoli]|uniref:hypothetical protein n=1 Tax=Paracoccus hibiscisoli TaxID=2023261 RepID=UPI001B7F7BAA